MIFSQTKKRSSKIDAFFLYLGTDNIKFFIYLLLGVIVNISSMSIALYYIQIGFDASQIATLTGISFVGALFQPILGYFIDRTKLPLMILQISLGAVILISFLLTMTTEYFLFVILVFCLSLFRLSLFSIFDTYNINEVQHSNGNFGKLRSGGSLGFGLGSFLIIPFTGVNDYVNIFYVIIVLALCAMLLLNLLEDRILHTKRAKPISQKKIKFTKTFYLLVIFNLILMGMMSLKMSYQPILLESLGASTGIISIANFAIIIPEFLLIGKTEHLTRNLKDSTVFMIALGISVLQLFLLTTTKNIYLLIFVFSLHGLAMAFYIPGFSRILRKNLVSEISGRGFLVNISMQSLGIYLINFLIITPLYINFGVAYGFLGIMVVLLLDYIVLLFLSKKIN